VITAATGQIEFDDGIRIAAHEQIAPLLATLVTSNAKKNALPIVGWHHHLLGEHDSSFGRFAVEVVSDRENRAAAVFLSHCHSFYDPTTPDDSERRTFHESIIASDLLGQREFAWGQVFCRVEHQANRDWLVVIYTPFASIPLHEREAFRVLRAHEPEP
jgi:hypothetical protein